jgi:hypothetical protein
VGGGGTPACRGHARREGRARARGAEILGFNPDAEGRLLAGKAFFASGDLGHAAEVCAGVAHDLNAAPIIRSDAFAALVRALAADLGEWRRASREWGACQEHVRVLTIVPMAGSARGRSALFTIAKRTVRAAVRLSSARRVRTVYRAPHTTRCS